MERRCSDTIFRCPREPLHAGQRSRTLTVEFRALGSLELLDEQGRPVSRILNQPKRLALLAYLALARPAGFHRRDTLLAMFWPDSDTARARAALRKSLYVLRQSVGRDVITSRGDDEIGVDHGLLHSDVTAFEEAVAAGRSARALEAYHGALLEGFHFEGASNEFETWLDGERSRLKKLAAEAAWSVSEDLESTGDLGGAVRNASRAFEITPPSGAELRRLLALLDRAGDRASALRAYEKYASWIREEFDAEPSPETTALAEAIRGRSESDPGSVEPLGPHAVPELHPIGAVVSNAEGQVGLAPRLRLRRAGILVGFLAAAASIPILLALSGPESPPLDENLVAVAPFRVFDAEHEMWSEGIVDYLARSLDQVGSLNALSPTTAVRAWPGRPDVASAMALGESSGAGIVVFGTLMGVGSDSVRINATIVDVAREEVIGDIAIRGDMGRMDQMVDSLTVEVLRDLAGTRRIGASRLTGIGSRSMPALMAFLQGEQSWRRTAWDSAQMQYARAVQLDSTFALAWLRLGSALLFMDRETEYGSGWAHVYQAGELNAGYSKHDSLVLAIGHQVAAGVLGRTEDGDPDANALRAYRTALQATTLYPEDPNAWFMLGVVREILYDNLTSVTIHQIADAYSRAIELDSAFAPAYRSAFRYALDDGRIDDARKFARQYLSLNPPDAVRGTPLLLDRMLDPEVTEAQMQAVLDSLHPLALFGGWIRLWLLPDSAERAIRVARESVSREHDTRYWQTADFIVDRNLAATLAYRGHLREALEIIGTDDSSWFQMLLAELAQLGAVPAETADSVFAEWLTRAPDRLLGVKYVPWWWAARRDTAALIAYIEKWDDAIPRGAGVALEIARGDTAAAIEAFPSRRDHWDDDTFAIVNRARLLIAAGRENEAHELLRHRTPNDWPLASRVVWALERARLAERLGNTDLALRDYLFVTRVWRHADPELQPYVAEAAAGVERLRLRG